jgi:hypothetical protein
MAHEETKFDKRIDNVVDRLPFSDSVKDGIRNVSKDINHVTDDVAQAFVDALEGLGNAAKDLVGGKPAKHNPDVDPTTKMGK